ncbi:hypothetical protein AJ80_05870 [Polytolypa hystricis UAMH7299]|uniref:Short chain dehydrogenase/reductase n=1 Tax=Polytolypa hystricis (strain UAMH7299) TaxID=1447883 RepID=A0A2B7XZU8_POLH7|nr:hypothetical protein AJ80_05870 [Polytolypa hystricis UAMH7299]
MSSTVFRAGATALISGSGSGIGFSIAQLCRSYSMNLILIDVHAENLAKAHLILPDTATAKTMTHAMDVSDLSSWEFLREKVTERFPEGIDFLVLNAGASFKPKTGEGKKMWEDLEYFQKTFATNLRGVLNGISTFLPAITGGSPQGHRAVVITGSKQGITNPPGTNPAYNASKSAVKSIAEHLAHDLRSDPATSSNVSVHLLIPGWTYTTMTGSAGPAPDPAAKPKGAWLPSQVAEYMRTKMGQGKFYIVCPDDDVGEALDKARIAWAVGDIIEGRPALSRWDQGWKDKASEWINNEAKRRESEQ